jgi:calcium-dependent protein kinase
MSYVYVKVGRYIFILLNLPAYSKGIVHRDLKLENFLFESKTSSSPLVLIDFGLSKYFEPGEKLSQRVGSCYYTGERTVALKKLTPPFRLSTFWYTFVFIAAPEVLNGCYDHRCDNWSLGVLCFMLLSGSPPFFGKTVEDVYRSAL